MIQIKELNSKVNLLNYPHGCVDCQTPLISSSNYQFSEVSYEKVYTDIHLHAICNRLSDCLYQGQVQPQNTGNYSSDYFLISPKKYWCLQYYSSCVGRKILHYLLQNFLFQDHLRKTGRLLERCMHDYMLMYSIYIILKDAFYICFLLFSSHKTWSSTMMFTPFAINSWL